MTTAAIRCRADVLGDIDTVSKHAADTSERVGRSGG